MSTNEHSTGEAPLELPTEGRSESAPAGADGRPRVLPFYGLLDESGSMDGSPIRAINEALPRLHSAICEDFDVDSIVRFSLIAFASDADVTLPLCELSTVDTLPGVTAHGTTSYARAFQVLRDAIETDVPALQAQGFDVLRPVAFMYSDGCPDGGPEGAWRSDYDRLIEPGFAFRPHIIAFGIGEADRAVIAHVATLKGYMADEGLDSADALKTWATRLAQSMVASARSVAQGGSSLVVPPTPVGFQEIPLESLPLAVS